MLAERTASRIMIEGEPNPRPQRTPSAAPPSPLSSQALGRSQTSMDL
jgi:hypothetical protein